MTKSAVSERPAPEHRKGALEAGQQGEELYRSLFSHMLNGFAYCKVIFRGGLPQDFVYIEVNEAFERQTGLKNVVGKRVSQVIPGIRESDPGLFEIYGRVALTGIPETFETYVNALDMWFSISVYSPRKEYFVAVFDVITERKKAEAALRDSEKRLKATVVNAPIGIATSAADMRFLTANDAFCRIIGFTEAELQQKSIRDIIHPDDIAESASKLAELANGKISSFSNEKRYVKKDGTVITGRVMVSAVRDSDGKPYLYIAEMEDITESKKADDHIRESERKFSNLFRSIPDAIVLSTLDGRIVEANESMLRLTGYSLEEVIGHNTIELGLWPNPASRRNFIEALHKGRVVNLEVDYTKKSGDTINALLSADVIQQNGNNYILVIIRDVTERKRAEERFHNLVENLPLGLSITSPEGEYLAVNKAFLKMRGYDSKEELTQVPISARYFDPKDRERWLELVKEKGRLEGYEVRLKRKDGSIFWVSSTTMPQTNAAGTQELIAVTQDITERKLAEDRIRHAAEEWRTTFDSINDPISIQDRDCKLIRVNLAFAKLFNMKPKDLIGRYCHEMVHGTTEPTSGCPYHKTLQTKMLAKAEFFEPHLGRHLEITTSPIFDDKGEVVACVHATRDITERKLTEKLLKESEQNFRNSLDGSPLGIRIVTSEGKQLYCNRTILNIYGYASAKELAATPAWKRYTNESYIEHQVRKERRQRGEDVATDYKISIVRKDGSVRDLAVTRAETLWNGKWEFQVVYQDITDNNRAEEFILRSFSELNTILNAVADPMLVIRMDHTIQRANQAAASVFGIDQPDDIRGKKCYDAFSPNGCAYRETSRCPLQMIASGAERVDGASGQIEGICCPKEHLLTATSFVSKDRIKAGMVVTLKDMREVNRSHRQAYQGSLMASLGQMVAGIAHEVNNPLGSILLYSELLLATETAAATRKDLRVIRSEAKRAADIMTKLLTYARSGQHHQRRINVLNPLRKVLKLRQYQERVYNVTTVSQIPNEAFIVNGNTNQIMQVFMNILLNAEDAVKDKTDGKIIVTAERDRQWARITISDNGTGMTSDVISHIFHPFFTTKEIGKGTGLGLSVCYGIVTAHGGVIRAENNRMGGATFIVELPLVASSPLLLSETGDTATEPADTAATGDTGAELAETGGKSGSKNAAGSG